MILEKEIRPSVIFICTIKVKKKVNKGMCSVFFIHANTIADICVHRKKVLNNTKDALCNPGSFQLG